MQGVVVDIGNIAGVGVEPSEVRRENQDVLEGAALQALQEGGANLFGFETGLALGKADDILHLRPRCRR